MHSIPPDLFSLSPIKGIELLSLPIPYVHFDAPREPRRPIGKQIEDAVQDYFQASERYDLVIHGLQIADKGITIGELDFIVRDLEADLVFHLELVHKFYIYDEEEGDTVLERLVGPNRKDRLTYKLAKLRDHQFPLLHHPLTRPHLTELGLRGEDIVQRLCFRGEVYLPSSMEPADLDSLMVDPEAVRGTYAPLDDLLRYSEDPKMEFRLCSKQDWIRDMDSCDRWLTYEDLHDVLRVRQEDGRAVMVWVRTENRIDRLMILFEQ